MKALLFVLLLVLAGGAAYYFYFKDHPIALVQGPDTSVPGKAGSGAAPTPGAKKDFKDLDARLQADMDHIPVNLRGARQIPGRALETKTRLTPYVQLHEEYQTVLQACDLIIGADQTYADHQAKCGLGTLNPGAGPQERARAAAGASPAVYQQQQALWTNQRQQADSRVRQLLATLENRRL